MGRVAERVYLPLNRRISHHLVSEVSSLPPSSWDNFINLKDQCADDVQPKKASGNDKNSSRNDLAW